MCCSACECASANALVSNLASVASHATLQATFTSCSERHEECGCLAPACRGLRRRWIKLTARSAHLASRHKTRRLQTLASQQVLALHYGHKAVAWSTCYLVLHLIAFQHSACRHLLVCSSWQDATCLCNTSLVSSARALVSGFAYSLMCAGPAGAHLREVIRTQARSANVAHLINNRTDQELPENGASQGTSLNETFHRQLTRCIRSCGGCRSFELVACILLIVMWRHNGACRPRCVLCKPACPAWSSAALLCSTEHAPALAACGVCDGAAQRPDWHCLLMPHVCKPQQPHRRMSVHCKRVACFAGAFDAWFWLQSASWIASSQRAAASFRRHCRQLRLHPAHMESSKGGT